MNGFTGKRNPGIPRWAQQREFFLVGVAAFGAFVGRLGRLGTFVGRLGRSVETLHATSLQPRPLRPPNPSNRPPNPSTTTINRKQNNIITIPNG